MTDGSGLLDPCEKENVDSAAYLTVQQREDLTLAAQVINSPVLSVHCSSLFMSLASDGPISLSRGLVALSGPPTRATKALRSVKGWPHLVVCRDGPCGTFLA